METAKMTRKQRREASTTHLIKEPSKGFPRQLICHGPANEGEWEDGDAEWSVGVLTWYPEIPQPPAGTVKVMTGYGSLCAINGSNAQIAVLVDGTWEKT